MAIDFSYKIKGNVLHVNAWGYDESLQDVEAYGKKVLEICLEQQVKKVLTDERKLEYRISAVDLYELASYYEKILPRGVYIALVYHPKYAADIDFWETTSRNRGIQVRAFTDKEEAEAWLSAKP